MQKRHRYLDYLIDSSFRASHKRYYLPKVEIKDYHVMIDGRNFFDQLIKSKLRTYDDVLK